MVLIFKITHMSRMNRWQITKIAIKKETKRLQNTPPKKIPTSQFLMLFMDTIPLACLRWLLEKKHGEFHQLIISTGSTVDRKKQTAPVDRLIGSFIPTIYKVFFTSPGGEGLGFLPSTVGVFTAASTYVGSTHQIPVTNRSIHQISCGWHRCPSTQPAWTVRGVHVADEAALPLRRGVAMPGRIGSTTPPGSGVNGEEPSKTPNC